jgi:hypothetical protein
MSVAGVTKIASLKGHDQVHTYADDGGVVVTWNPKAKGSGFSELFEKMNTDLGSPPDFVSDWPVVVLLPRLLAHCRFHVMFCPSTIARRCHIHSCIYARGRGCR